MTLKENQNMDCAHIKILSRREELQGDVAPHGIENLSIFLKEMGTDRDTMNMTNGFLNDY